MNCPKCNIPAYKDGFHLRGDERQQRYRCKCGATFYDPSVPRPSMRGRANRNRRMPDSIKQKISRALRQRVAQGLPVGQPRKNPVYRFVCRICGKMAEDRTGNATRVVCGKECAVRAASQARQKLPPDEIVAQFYLSGLACTKVAEMFGVEHHAVLEALKRLGIPRRKHTVRQYCKESGCQERVHRIWHAKLKVWYGTQCKKHLNEYKESKRRKKCITQSSLQLTMKP